MRNKKEINIQIGEQIKYAREKIGFTQEQLAEKVEVSPQFVSDLERGLVGVSLSTLKRICVALHVSSDQILFGRKTDNRTAMIAEICKPLSEQQFYTLQEILEKIVYMISVQE